MRKYLYMVLTLALLVGTWVVVSAQTGITTFQVSQAFVNSVNAAIAKINAFPFNGTTLTNNISMNGFTLTGPGSISPANLNGVINVLAQGVVCDGTTDNTTNFQAAINAARQISGTGVGIVNIPGSCNTSTNHSLYIASGVTIPDNVVVQGLGGSCYVGDPCVQIKCGMGSGACITSTSTHGAGLIDVNLFTSVSGSSGLKLDGTFHFNVKGDAISGFSNNGLWLAENSSSAIYNYVYDNNITNNGTNLFLDGTGNPAKAIGGNSFYDNQFTSASGNNNVVATSFSSVAGAAGYQNVYQNDFENTDLSLGNGSAITGFVSNATLNTTFENVTGESLQKLFVLNAGTNNFDVRGIEGAILSTSPFDVFSAVGDATYNVCMGYLAGVGGSKCFSTMPQIQQYTEPTAWQDPTGQIGVGALTNLMTHSEDFTNAAWTASGIASSGNTATSPAGVANGATAAVLTPSGAAFYQQAYTLGSSIAGTCWTGSVWLQAASGTARAQLALFDSAGAQLAIGGLASTMLTTNWKRVYVTGCASGADAQTGIRFRPLYFSTAPTATINLWGAQLTETNGPQPYIKTVASTITTTAVGSINPSFATGLTPGISGGGSLATGSSSFSGTVTSAAATGNVLTPGRICPNATICVLSDETTLGGAKVTASSTTSCTFSATGSDTVDYQASCR